MPETILILDDDAQARDSLAINLEDAGFIVDQVDNSEDALDHLKEHHADLVVVDLRLPGMDGPEFIQVAKKTWQTLKFIVYTGSPEFNMPTQLAVETNVSNAIFLKPLSDFEPMITEIQRMLK